MDAADIVLVNDEIREIPHLLQLSRRMTLTIKCFQDLLIPLHVHGKIKENTTVACGSGYILLYMLGSASREERM